MMRPSYARKAASLVACLFLLTACGDKTPPGPASPTETSSNHVKPLPPADLTPPAIEPLPPVTENPSATPLTTEAPSQPPTPSPSDDTSPTSTAPKPKPTKPPKPKTVALTFDDGPSPYTLEVLKILQEEEVPATFFVTGVQVKQYPRTLKLLSEAGMSVQNHSWRHSDLTTLGPKTLAADINDTSALITHNTGKAPTCVRPPYGAHNPQVDTAIRNSGAEVYLWNVDSEDWKKSGSDKILQHTLETLHPESVILMHDGVEGREQTVAMLPKLIKELKKDGHTFIYACKP